MTIDLRGLSYIDSLKLVRDAIALSGSLKEEVVAFFEAFENEKCALIIGFIELLKDCKTVFQESNGFYILKIIPSTAF